MIIRLIIKNKAFKIQNQYGLDFSNNQVTFSDIAIDFTEGTIADLPYKYQEIQIRQAETEENILNGKILFVGYVEEFSFEDMHISVEKGESRELTITLLSPLAMAVRRNVSLIGTYQLNTAILRIIQPLIDDGFILKEMNITDGQITVNFVLESVEYCMNNIGFKRNIFWYINEKKEIFINSIDYLFGNSISKTISELNCKENSLYYIKPTIKNIDYANVINFKNIRLIYSEKDSNNEDPLAEKYGYNVYPILNLEKNIKNGDIITFNNPIIIDEDTLRNIISEKQESNTYYSIYLKIRFSYEQIETYEIKINYENNVQGSYQKVGNITFNDEKGEEGDVVLQRDSFFSNLITGFKWNGNGAIIQEIKSDTALRYTTMRFMYSAEINKMKSIISNSGQIEKPIDYNEQWTTLPQLISYARSLMVQNSNEINQIVLKFSKNPNINIGDLVDIGMEKFFSNGKFAVVNKKYTYINDNDEDWQITVKNSDLISTYIDMFRPQEKEENQEHIDTVVLSEFIEEKINETHIIEVENED